MKTNILILSLLFAATSLMAQTYYAINFTGTGANPSSVLVENLTKGTTVSLPGTDTLHLDLGTGIHEMQATKNKLSIYPNPMDQSCTFEFFHAEKGMVAIRLFSVEGRQIHQYSKELAQGKHRFLLSGVPAGVYVISIISGGEHISGRFVSTAQAGAAFSLRYIDEAQSVIMRKRTTEQPHVDITAGMTEGSKSIVVMSFSQGDQLRFTGSATGFPNDTVYGSPTGNQTMHFVFSGVPTVTTVVLSSITSSGAVSGGNVVYSGGYAVTARGICWSTNPNPTIASSHTSNGTGVGSFTSSISGLNHGTYYYVRAYATNSLGTAYGKELSFAAVNPGEVFIPGTGKIWLDKNLGASQVATSLTDTAAYGHLYQWGRLTDGHQFRTSTIVSTTSSVDNPGHGNFIHTNTHPFDWRVPQNNNLWQGVTGLNNPCPLGYRIPTEEEWLMEIQSWKYISPEGVFASPLRLTRAGRRLGSSLLFVGENGYYWYSNIISGHHQAKYLFFLGNWGYTTLNSRQVGVSVRCIREFMGKLTVVTKLEHSVPFDSIFIKAAVTNDGGFPVIARGFCWSNSQFPTIANQHTTEALGTLEFSRTFTSFNYGTVYYVRSYAINAQDTAYGNQLMVIPLNANQLYHPSTGRIWMDRNLGASNVATSSNDTASYGHLYQWGRATDGHQIRTSGTTTSLSSTNTPGHGNFILAPGNPSDWRSPQNFNLWQGVNGENNPCPTGFRLPTLAEWYAERENWNTNNSAGAFSSPLKLSVAGLRIFSSGSLSNVGILGYYWSSTVDGNKSKSLSFGNSSANLLNSYHAYGHSVRCIKD